MLYLKESPTLLTQLNNTIITSDNIKNSIFKFDGWLNSFGPFSHDPMDFFGSKIGLKIRELYFKNSLIGFPLAALSTLVDVFFPSLMKVFRHPSREPIAEAHYILGYLNLYDLEKNDSYLVLVNDKINFLLSSKCNNYDEYCWGYTFKWQTGNGTWDANTPYITVTPYCYYAFKKFYQVTKDDFYLNICNSILNYTIQYNKKKIFSDRISSCSYSPKEKSVVINANTYRAAMLMDGFDFFKKEIFMEEAEENIEFVLMNQQEDGSWFYEALEGKTSFIDNFHTALVLKNLTKYYIIKKDLRVLDAITRGYSFYRNNLFYENGKPRHFYMSKNPKFRKYEMYDYAEAISLVCLIRNIGIDDIEFALDLFFDLINDYQTHKGYFVTRVNSLGLRNKIPYHRWPQSQLFYALTNLYKTILKNNN